MNATHTPGPWNLSEGGFHVYYLNPQIEAGDEDINDPRHDSVICDTRNIAYDPAYSGIPDAELKANARLIAASPDLLAACESFVAAFHDHPDRDEVSFAMAKTAIAKAKSK